MYLALGLFNTFSMRRRSAPGIGPESCCDLAARYSQRWARGRGSACAPAQIDCASILVRQCSMSMRHTHRGMLERPACAHHKHKNDRRNNAPPRAGTPSVLRRYSQGYSQGYSDCGRVRALETSRGLGHGRELSLVEHRVREADTRVTPQTSTRSYRALRLLQEVLGSDCGASSPASAPVFDIRLVFNGNHVIEANLKEVIVEGVIEADDVLWSRAHPSQRRSRLVIVCLLARFLLRGRFLNRPLLTLAPAPAPAIAAGAGE
mmetsp:Transcript_48621/g.136813  ORF Transcript_48621/g.136813 Transcript_48621/m.136813 type:complete len:262 (-) Transcript_48621:1042-1827(-)